MKQDCEYLDVLNYSKDSAYAISSLKNRRREIKIGYQKASTLTVALIFEQALFTRFFSPRAAPHQEMSTKAK